MKITYLSHSCFLVETSKARLIVDPFLSGNPKARTSADEIECDYIVVTHGHSDHVGDAIGIAKRTGATIVATFECAMWCAAQGVKVHPMHIGGAHEFPFGRIKWTIAHHGSGYQDGDRMLYMGNPAGVVIGADGRTVYHAGDTGLFMDMQLIGQMNRLDVALLPIGDNFTMGIDDAVKAAEFLRPKLAVPMHYGTFDLIDVDPGEFATKAAAAGIEAKALEIGESLEI